MHKVKHRRYRIAVQISSVLFMILLQLQMKVFVFAAEIPKRVLYISSYSQSFESVPEQLAGIESVFNGEAVSVDYEYMDTKRLDTKENRDLFYALLAYKMAHVAAYDAIIVGDDNALDFAIQYHDTLFAQIPVVFLGINDEKRALEANTLGHFTGVVENAPLKENIELALQFNPDAKRVVAIVDNTLTGIGDRAQFYAIESQFPQLRFSHINGSEYTIEALGSQLESIRDDTILLFMSLYADVYGRNVTIDEGVRMIREHARVPVYRQSIGGVGDGILGGKMVSYHESGAIAARMVLSLLSGTSIHDIPVILESPNRYILDYQLIVQYKLPDDAIPADAILVNKPVSFYDMNRDFVNAVLAIISVFAILCALLFIDNRKRKKIERELKSSLEKLNHAHEELMVSEEEIRTQYHTIQERVDDIELLNQKFEIAVESTDSAVWELRIEDEQLFLSNSFSFLVGERVKNTQNTMEILKKYLGPEELERLLQAYQCYLNKETAEIDVQLGLQLPSGDSRWVWIKGKEAVDSRGYSKLLHGIIVDMTKVKDQEIFIEHLAFHDYLTGLPNRRKFQLRLEELIENQTPFAVMLLDIDNFKAVNDTMGHTNGDMLLQDVSSRMRNIEDEWMMVSRFGGDEFLFLVSEVTTHKELEPFIHRIHEAMKSSYWIHKTQLMVQYTIGISFYPKDGESMDEMIMHADTALYHGKKTGKNMVLYYTDAMKQEVKIRTEIESILRDAITHDGFKLLYQPIIDVQTGAIVSYEALLRLKHHAISPDRFIGVAEEIGLIIELGRWVTKEAVKQLTCWRSKGLQLVPISINFSSKQLLDAHYMLFLKELLFDYEIDAHYLEIEITESVLFEKREDSLEFLQQLQQMGISLALDDFGTGYSSLNYLTYMPVNKVKLDKSLCDRFLEMEGSEVMESIISLAHSLHLQITAEGIEKMDQYQRLISVGCDYAQGYLFSKPLEVEAAEALISKTLITVNT